MEERLNEQIAQIDTANRMLLGQKQVLEMIATGASLPDILDILTRTIESQSQEEILCSVLLLDADGRNLRQAAAPSLPKTYIQSIDGIAISSGVGSCATAAYLRQPVVVSDIASDPMWGNFRELALSHGLLACCSMPIFSSMRKVLGTFAMYYRTQSSPSPENLELIQTACHLAGIAIEQKQNQQALKQANEELKQRVQARSEELVKAYVAIASSQKRFLSLFIENAPSAIAMFDREMRYLLASQRWLLAHRLEDNIIGRSHYEVFPNIPERWKAVYQRCLAGAVESCEEDCLPHADGTMDWVRWEAHPWRDRAGEVGGIIIFTEVITQRKQAEQKLKQTVTELARSNTELEQFAYVASHDLREPLRKIKSFADLLAKRYSGQLDDKADKYIAYITDGAIRMQELITDLLLYSQVGRGEIALEPTDIGAVLNQVLTDLSTAIQESKAVIKADLLPTVRANPRQMQQLLQNLIANAIKFRGLERPQIQIKAALHEKSWLFSITDNGIGIEPQYAERIFVIFQRLHTKEEYSGTGIGLAICKKIVERHGGQIWFESELGRGTTFCFTLKAA